MNEAMKQSVRNALKTYVTRCGSQRKASATLKEVSAATINKILNNTDTGSISDEMWLSLYNQLGAATLDNEWIVCEQTDAYKRMNFVLNQCQNESLVAAVIGEAGAGKSEANKRWAQQHKNVLLLTCGEHWNRKEFINKLLEKTGAKPNGATLAEMVDEVVLRISRMADPILILDEADKLSDPVFYFFITLYNQLEYKCGIVMTATAFLEKRIRRGLRLGKRGYEEIYSRLGRKFVYLNPTSDNDIHAVCLANGIADTQTIKKIIKQSEGDLRRTRRAIWVEKQRIKSELLNH